MSVLSLMAQLGLNASGYETKLKQVQSLSRSVGHEITSELKGKLGAAFSGVAIEEAVRRTGEYAEKLRDLSNRTSLSTADLQAFDFAASHAGSSLDTVITAIEKLGIAQSKALGPQGAEIFAALERLGLSAEQIRDTSAAAENFKRISEHVRNAAIDGQLLADMTEALGRSARELIPTMKEGLGEAAEHLKAIHGLMTDDQIARMAAQSEKFKSVWAAIRPVVAEVTGFLSTAALKVFEMGEGLGHLMHGGMKEVEQFRKTLELRGNQEFVDAAHSKAVRENLARHPAAPGGEAEASGKKTEADRVHEEFLKEKNRLELASASDAEKQVILRKRIAEIEEQASHPANRMRFSVNPDPADKMAFEKAKAESFSLQTELQNLINKPDHPERVTRNFDSLARIGGLGQTADIGGILRTPLQEIARATRETANHTARFMDH
jgi:hypothetical protein